MKGRLPYVWGVLLLTIAISHPAAAQIIGQSNNQAPPSTTPSVKASDLVITPRVGVGYTTPGGGYDGFANIQGFIPLKQTPGKNLLFLEGRFLLDNDANPGGSLVLGYRAYQTAANRIYGAYLAYDNRDTGSNVFSQVGLGLETLGEGWDARVNGYIPAGNTRQTVRENTIASNSYLVDSTRFQANQLVVSGTRQQLTIRDLEAAMAGFDAEVGGRLVKFPDDGGDLRGYGGLYYLSAAGSPSVVGVRGRLEARVTDNLLLGVAVQHDGLFGTNVFGTIALTLPGVRPKGAAPKSLLARMAESPTRIGTIAIDHQRETTSITVPVSDLTIDNPTTGQPYFFQHVIVGRSGGDGTIENPFGVIDSALAATRSDGNSIVYVQAGTNSGIPAFTVRDRVQVLSTFPTQIIPAAFQGQRIPDVRLDLSGIGAIRPTVNGTITMGSDTVLSGFNITSTTGAGVTFNNINRVEIRDNVIQNTADAGILGNGVAIANIFRNQITSARNQGIYLQNVGIANITDNTVANTLAGTTTIANPITGDIAIGGITIPNPGSIIPLPSGQGIVIATTSGDTNIARNTVTGTATQGIVLLNARGNTAIADNSITNTIGADFTTNIPPLGNITLTTGQGIVVAGVNGNLEVSRNTVNTVRGQGIAVAGALNGTTTLANNTVRNAVDQGMVIAGTSGTTNIFNNQISDIATRNLAIANPIGIGPAVINVATGQGLTLINSIGTVNITGNTIERVQGAFSTAPAPDAGQGIAVANFSGQVNLNITNNQIRNNFNDAILVGLLGRPSGTTSAATANITIADNTLENNGGAAPVRGDGIAIGIEQDAVVNNLLIENNIIRGNGDEGIDIRLGLQAVPIVNPTSARLTGTIRNNTITNNGQNGVQVEARGGTIAKIVIASNNSSNNGQRGLFVTTSNIILLGTPQISADIRLNTLTANAGGGTGILTTTSGVPPSAPQSICVNLVGNISTNASAITNTANVFGPNTLTVVNLALVNANNTGGVTFAGVPAPVDVPACP
ncbi:right-handed parallel beta-helix repeat-containing protein [Phormidium sp. CLA17]|uniref:right-handed parallel beta-helix repeat-containing protein n=1 Tax=Leptolyngbya sp. Cla-17 TaxID=2803751 RepID=UPI00149200FD|nr:right-handed parallel beta-helix repeat-containing protein [Leptolyngbya sp. Cla-17]MBM0742899.1 right-handed parallel beta-helix repeat-containing protein [Leptolyngbya sp. Cla-17]